MILLAMFLSPLSWLSFWWPSFTRLMPSSTMRGINRIQRHGVGVGLKTISHISVSGLTPRLWGVNRKQRSSACERYPVLEVFGSSASSSIPARPRPPHPALTRARPCGGPVAYFERAGLLRVFVRVRAGILRSQFVTICA